ncbi:acetylcholine receptor subunit alpha [Elysia marginata]|uniref:Acetylcholine receptor subunit alpha n=1 Tax=Elysia marginata TaxID=1093978 RepID=A0AAV4HY77_9GAST|nr:acetylcholine receptor subunit alpha [Elysia marginata]
MRSHKRRILQVTMMHVGPNSTVGVTVADDQNYGLKLRPFFYRGTKLHSNLLNASFKIVSPDGAGENYSIRHRRLVEALLENHDPEVIPVPTNGDPLNVSLTLFLVDILEVDIESNQVEFLFYLNKEYIDETLVWDPEMDIFNLDAVRLRRKQVWQPDVVFQDDIGSLSHQPEQSDLVEIKHDGTVTITDKRRIRTLCQVYALSDRHAAICEVKVAPSSYDRSLLWLNQPTQTTPNGMLFSPASKYQLLEIRARKDTLHYQTASYEEMVFTITFGRITPPE